MSTYHNPFAIISLATILSFGASVVAQVAPSSLLFTPKADEFTLSGTGGTVLSMIGRRAIGVVTPGGAACNYSAEKFGPLVAHQTLVGDEDNDGDVHTPRLFGAVQALLVKSHKWNANGRTWDAITNPINLRDVYITPKKALGTDVSGVPGLRPCDSGRIYANGRIRHFITGEQIIQALGMINSQGRPLTPDALSLDAITLDPKGNIYLSYEKDNACRLYCGDELTNYTLRDGGVAVILAAFWTPTSGSDVFAVADKRGRIALTEARIDAMQANARLADAAGACPTATIDLDGLAVDRRVLAGTFVTQWCKQKMTLPNLLFSTEAFTGAGVASTRNNGEIARVNGCLLAQGCTAVATPSDGTKMGLRPGLSTTTLVGSLDGLVSLLKEPCRFVMGTANPNCLGGLCKWSIATNMNVPTVLLYAGNGALPISPAQDFFATFGLMTDCFPEIFPNVFVHGPITVPMAADGWGGRVGTLGPFGIPAAAAPNGLISQAFTVHNGRWQLSTPMTFH